MKTETQPQTLHARIAHTLISRIQAGEWRIGDFLPPEYTLCARLGVSRHTLRHALQSLESQGFVVRRQGSGTRVISRQRPRRFTHTINSMAELMRYPRTTVRENKVVGIIESDTALAQTMKAAAGSSWLHIGAVRRETESDLLVAWSDIYISPRFADVVNKPEHQRTMVCDQIEQYFGVSVDRAEFEIFSERLSDYHAAELGLPTGLSCLVIVRRYYSVDGELFEVTVTRHPEKRFVFSMEMRRSQKT